MYFSLPYSQRWPPHGKLRSSKLLQIHAYWTTLALEAIKSGKRHDCYGVFCRTLVHHSGRAHGSSITCFITKSHRRYFLKAGSKGREEYTRFESCFRPVSFRDMWHSLVLCSAVDWGAADLLKSCHDLFCRLSLATFISGSYSCKECCFREIELSIYDASTERGRVSSSWIKSSIQHHRLRVWFTLHAKDVAWYQSSLTL